MDLLDLSNAEIRKDIDCFEPKWTTEKCVCVCVCTTWVHFFSALFCVNRACVHFMWNKKSVFDVITLHKPQFFDKMCIAFVRFLPIFAGLSVMINCCSLNSNFSPYTAVWLVVNFNHHCSMESMLLSLWTQTHAVRSRCRSPLPRAVLISSFHLHSIPLQLQIVRFIDWKQEGWLHMMSSVMDRKAAERWKLLKKVLGR